VIQMTCLCCAVQVQVDRRPDPIVECNCSACSKTGARWGYFEPEEVQVEGETVAYRRADKPEPSAEFHFCGKCGAITHYVLTESAVAKHGNVQMGVNMWLADPADLKGVTLQFPDGRSWSGDGPFGYVRPAIVLGDQCEAD